MRTQVLRALLEGKSFTYNGVECTCTGKYSYTVKGVEINIDPDDTLTAVIAQFDAATL